jgi:hypothetical protein
VKNLPKLEKVVRIQISAKYGWHDIETNCLIEKIVLQRNPVIPIEPIVQLLLPESVYLGLEQA